MGQKSPENIEIIVNISYYHNAVGALYIVKTAQRLAKQNRTKRLKTRKYHIQI